MRRFKKILKWTGLILLLIISGLVATIMLRQNLKYDAPYPDIHASTDSAIINKGKRIVFGPAHCAECHTQTNVDSVFKLGQEISLVGGRVFELPLGKIYSKNITADKETGIGNYTDGEIARALRYGVHPDGTAVFDFMPFHDMTDEDLTAVISFIRTQKPVKNEVPKHALNFMGKAVKAFLIKPVGPSKKIEKTIARDSSANYGRYLAMDVANCNGCHTKRTLSGEFTGKPFAGGGNMGEGGVALYPPNLTTDSSSRIFGWTQEQFIARFRMGRRIPQSHMPWESYGRMDDNDLKAIYKFLKTLKPEKTTPAE